MGFVVIRECDCQESNYYIICQEFHLSQEQVYIFFVIIRRSIWELCDHRLFITTYLKMARRLNEPTIAAAILDKLEPKFHRIEPKGKSLG